MIVKPADFLKCDARFKHWGKVFTAKDFDEKKDNGYAIGGKFVRWGDSVSLNAGEFMVCAAETGSRGKHSYDYALVIGGPAARLIDRDCLKGDPLWKEFLAKREATFDETIVAKAKNNTLYRMGLFAVWLAIQAEGGEVKTELPVYLSKVDDEALAAELTSRGWTCEREPDGGHRPESALAEMESQADPDGWIESALNWEQIPAGPEDKPR